MESDDVEQWEKIRSMGKWYFVFWHGALGWGGFWFFSNTLILPEKDSLLYSWLYALLATDGVLLPWLQILIKIMLAVAMGVSWIKFLQSLVFDKNWKSILLWGVLLLVIIVGCMVSIGEFKSFLSEFGYLSYEYDSFIQLRYQDYAVIFSQSDNDFPGSSQYSFFSDVEGKNKRIWNIILFMFFCGLLGCFTGLLSWHSQEKYYRKELAKREGD